MVFVWIFGGHDRGTYLCRIVPSVDQSVYLAVLAPRSDPSLEEREPSRRKIQNPSLPIPEDCFSSSPHRKFPSSMGGLADYIDTWGRRGTNNSLATYACECALRMYFVYWIIRDEDVTRDPERLSPPLSSARGLVVHT